MANFMTEPISLQRFQVRVTSYSGCRGFRQIFENNAGQLFIPFADCGALKQEAPQAMLY
jgi:hypothetical protein